jgi:hypothetical protein
LIGVTNIIVGILNRDSMTREVIVASVNKYMTAENQICILCPGRTCANQGTGRLVNDTDKQHPFDLIQFQ